MMDEQWEKRADGNLIVQPVLGYAFARLPQAALLRVIYAATQEDFDARKPSTVQLALNVKVAREMARVLNQIADTIEPPPPAFTVAASAAEALPAAHAAALSPPATSQAAAPATTESPRDMPGAFGYSIGDDPEELTFDYRS